VLICLEVSASYWEASQLTTRSFFRAEPIQTNEFVSQAQLLLEVGRPQLSRPRFLYPSTLSAATKKKKIYIYIYTKGDNSAFGLRIAIYVAGLVGAGFKCLPHSCCCRCCYCCCCCYSSLQLSERDMLILGTPLTSVAGRAGAHHDNSIM